MSDRSSRPAPVFFGCRGPALDPEERAFFRDASPLGFILFARNVAAPEQLRRLIGALRDCAAAQVPIMIDQEGGRVQRLRPPHWRQAPAARRLGILHGRNPAAALRATWLNARLIAAELADLGIDIDTAPVLDLPVTGAHDVIGDRAYGGDPGSTGALGRAAIDGLLAGGVLPVIKHIPGHGRAAADSHERCPVVTTSATELESTDLAPFRLLCAAPLAMTAHVVYAAWDPDRPATLSPIVIDEVIRQRIGFAGALISDDLSMGALSGSLAARTNAAQRAGCDILLHCNGRMPEMIEVSQATVTATDAARTRIEAALARRRPPEPFDHEAASAELDGLIGEG